MFLRKFIIMSKQSSKDVKGHARLEVRGAKGRLSFSLEGVKFKDHISYELLAVTDEKGGFKQVSLGTLDVNSSGKGRLELAFNANTVGQSQISITQLNILVLKERDTLENQEKIILAGYIHEDDNSIQKSIKQIQELQKSKSSEVEAEVKEKIEVKEEVEVKEEIKVKEEVESKMENKNQVKKEIEIDEKLIFKSSEKQEEKALEKESNSKDYNDHVARYTLDLLKFFKETEPFKLGSEGQRWWQIDYDKSNSNLGFLPYYSYISHSPYESATSKDYATCQSQIRKYKKYLFGIAKDGEKITHYIYAIPGKRIKSEHPYGGSTGFVTWLEDKDDEGFGYWLSYINADTGNVVRPI